MSIFGPKIKEPKNFDTTKFFKTFIKFLDNKGLNLSEYQYVEFDEDRWSLYDLLFRQLDLNDKDKIKALEKLVNTGLVIKNEKEIVLDAEFMMYVVKPLAYALVNPNKDLSKWIQRTHHRSYKPCSDPDFYNSLSDEEAKIIAIRRSANRDIIYSPIKDDLKKLVLHSKFATLSDIDAVFNTGVSLSKEEVDIIWGKLKPRLLELTAYKAKTSDSTQYIRLTGAIYDKGDKGLQAERHLLENICEYLRHVIPEFNHLIADEVKDENGYVLRRTLWNPNSYSDNKCEYVNRAFVERLDDSIQFKLVVAREQDVVKKLQLEKDGLDKQFDAEIQAIKDFVAERKVKIQNIKSQKQEIEDKLKAIEEENKRKETERAKAELQKKQAEFEALAAKLGVNPGDLLALQQKSQQQH